LNERQIKAVIYVKSKEKITNREYQEINAITKKTASRDLTELVNISLFRKQGTTGKGTSYALNKYKGDKGDKGGIKGT
jgi:ATP-dependent DNA helicase RecG